MVSDNGSIAANAKVRTTDVEDFFKFLFGGSELLSGFDVYVARSETTGMRLTSMNSPVFSC